MMSQTSVHAQEKQDLYFNDVTSDNNTTYLSIPSNWYTDAEKTQQFTGSLDGTYNGNVTNTGQFNTKNQAHTAPTFYNLNYNVTEIDNSNLEFLILGNDSNVITKNDFNLNLQFAPKDGKSQLTYKFKLWANSGINVGNDWNINFDRNNSTNYLSILITDIDNGIGTAEYFKVNGNIVSKGTPFILSTQNKKFTVGGVVDLGGGQWNIGRSHPATSSFTRTIGGLGDVDGNGNGGGRLNITSTQALNVDLVLTNSGKNDFSTAFGMIENSTSKLNIKMQASNAANGHQIMRFDSHDTYWCNAFEIHDANINNVTVEKGRLDIGMHSKMKGNNLSIASNEAIFSATSLSTGGDCGRVIFDTMDFSAGKIVFDINEVENDFIQINGGIAKNSADAKLTFEIGVDALTLKEWLNASELDEFVVDIMSFKTDESSFVAEDILLETQSEVIGSIEFKPNTSTGLTSVSLTLVPEPATVAAILGVIAIGFAIYRRRR